MISVILPTYNEKENIIQLVKGIAKNLPGNGNKNYEIIIVDDNSPDGTSEEVNKYKKHDKNVKLITREKERGLASAIKTGINNSSGEYVIMMDTDLSHPPECLGILISTIKENSVDVVIASRYIKGGSMNSNRFKYLSSKTMNLLLGIILNLNIKDLTGGFFIIKKSLLEKVDLDKVLIGYGDYFFRLFYELKKINYTFKEIPFKYVGRKMGKSKTKTFSMGIDYLKTMISLRFGK